MIYYIILNAFPSQYKECNITLLFDAILLCLYYPEQQDDFFTSLRDRSILCKSLPFPIILLDASINVDPDLLYDGFTVSNIVFVKKTNTSSTPLPVLAEVSKKVAPTLDAYFVASSTETTLFRSKSNLFPTIVRHIFFEVDYRVIPMLSRLLVSRKG